MKRTEQISIDMPPEMLRLIEQSVESGEYASTSAVVREAMRLWKRRRDEHAETLISIKARIRQSLDDPRPDLSEEEARRRLDEYMAQAEQGL